MVVHVMRLSLFVVAALLLTGITAHADTFKFNISGQGQSGSGTIAATAASQ